MLVWTPRLRPSLNRFVVCVGLLLVVGALGACDSGVPEKNSPKSAAASSKKTAREDTMEEEKHWQIIALLNWKKLGDDDAVLEPAISALAAKPVDEIIAFEDWLARKLHALDGVEYAANIGQFAYRKGEYFSPDIFLYARCAVVANGPELYHEVLENPSEMIKDGGFEPLLYLSAKAHERKTGEPFDHVSEVSYETYANAEAWQ